jgi:hypothetical protein
MKKAIPFHPLVVVRRDGIKAQPGIAIDVVQDVESVLGALDLLDLVAQAPASRIWIGGRLERRCFRPVTLCLIGREECVS